MILEVDSSFSFERKAESDKNNLIVQQWGNLRSNYQKKLPGTAKDEKWQLMKMIFKV